jgi:hypothetical protein
MGDRKDILCILRNLTIIDVLEFSKEDSHTDGIETFVVSFTSSGQTVV